jgi:hypothetical protein
LAVRAVVIGGALGLVGWALLLALLGNLGLQQSVSKPPSEAFSDYGIQFLIVGAATLLLAYLASAIWPRDISPRWVLIGLLATEGIGALLLAPMLIGEITLSMAPAVMLVLTAFGLTLLGAYLGAVAGSRRLA